MQNAEGGKQNGARCLLPTAFCLLVTRYLVSLCKVCARHRLQNFLSSSLSVVPFLFLVDV